MIEWSRPAATSDDASVAPLVMRSYCYPPKHTCERVQQRSLQRAIPALIVHKHADHGNLRVYVRKPWELTSEARKALLVTFTEWASLCPDDFVGSRATVHLSRVEITKIPVYILTPFAESVAAHLVFQRVPL